MLSRTELLSLDADKREEYLDLLEVKEKTLKRDRLKRDLFALAKLIGFNDLGECHKEICKHLTTNKSKRRLFLFPRGHFKTSLITQANAIRLILENPNIRILVASSTLDNAKKSLGVIKACFWANPEFRELFHEWCPPEGTRDWGTQESFTVPNRTNRTLKEATVEAVGVGQTIVGRHYDYMIFSDIVTPENITTSVQIQKVKDWVAFAVSLLDQPDKNVTDVEGTRYAYDDYYGEVEDRARKNRGIFVYKKPAIVDGVVTFPERFSMEGFDKIREEQGEWIFCNPAEAPIMMSDWTTKVISQVAVGDEIIGFNTGKFRNQKTILVKSKVLAVQTRKHYVNKITMASGRVIRSTPEHNWYTGRSDKTHKEYNHAKVGRTMKELVNPFILESDELRLRKWGYLGGMIDGEGGCKHFGIFISQSKQVNGPVYDKIVSVLKELNIPFSEYDYKRFEKKRNGEDSSNSTVIYLKGGRETKFRLLNNCDFQKKEQILSGLWSRPTAYFNDDKIVSIEPDGYEDVYSLTTTSGNYVVWGYASKNSSQYMLEPIDESRATFKKADVVFVPRASIPRTKNNTWQYPLFTTVDPAISQDTKADESVITTGMFTPSNELYIIDMQHGHWSPTEFCDRLDKLYLQYKPHSIGIESVAFQKLLFHILNQYSRERGRIYPTREIQRNTRSSKNLRIMAVQPRFQQKRIYFADDLDRTYILNQLIRFNPERRDNKDDFLDTLADMEDIKIIPKREEPDKYALFPVSRYIDFLKRTDLDEDDDFGEIERVEEESEYYTYPA